MYLFITWSLGIKIIVISTMLLNCMLFANNLVSIVQNSEEL